MQETSLIELQHTVDEWMNADIRKDSHPPNLKMIDAPMKYETFFVEMIYSKCTDLLEKKISITTGKNKSALS